MLYYSSKSNVSKVKLDQVPGKVRCLYLLIFLQVQHVDPVPNLKAALEPLGVAILHGQTHLRSVTATVLGFVPCARSVSSPGIVGEVT